MTVKTPIRMLAATGIALALGAPLAQARVTIPEGTLATGSASAVIRSAPDAFERAVNARLSSQATPADVHDRSTIAVADTAAPPDWFERAVNAARGRSVPQDSHERFVAPAPSPAIVGDDGGIQWADLSIGVFLGLALGALGVLGALALRGRGRVAHS